MAEEVTPQPEPTYRKPVVDEAEATVAEDESDKKKRKKFLEELDAPETETEEGGGRDSTRRRGEGD